MAADDLVIETGYGLDDANSYITADEFLAYIDQRNLSVSASSDHDLIAGLLIGAKDYLEGKRNCYKGEKATQAQALQWPRVNVVIDNFCFSSEEIPQQLKDAQARIAYDLDANSLSEASPTLLPNDTGAIVKEKVDVLEVQYANPSASSQRSSPRYAEADSLLQPLCKGGGGGFFVKA